MINRYIPIVLALAVVLSACSSDNFLAQAPKVDINSTTGIASSESPTASPKSGGPLDFVAVSLGNDWSPDLANAYNVAVANNRPLAKACFGDLVDVTNALKPAVVPGAPTLGGLHLLSDLENLDVALSNTTINDQKLKAFGDCVAYVNDLKARSISVPKSLATVITGLATSLL